MTQRNLTPIFKHFRYKNRICVQPGEAGNYIICVPFMTYSTNLNIGTIPAKSSYKFDIMVDPLTETACTDYISFIYAQGSNFTTETLPIRVKVNEDYTGIAVVTVRDESTKTQSYPGTGVSGAKVTLMNQDNTDITYTGTTDNNGVATFSNVHTSLYNISTSKTGYTDKLISADFQPSSGYTNEINVGIDPLMVLTEWTVTEKPNVSDMYQITLNLTYKTDITGPQLIPGKGMLSYDAPAAGMEFFDTFTLHNYGNVPAYNVTFVTPGFGAQSGATVDSIPIGLHIISGPGDIFTKVNILHEFHTVTGGVTPLTAAGMYIYVQGPSRWEPDPPFPKWVGDFPMGGNGAYTLTFEMNKNRAKELQWFKPDNVPTFQCNNVEITDCSSTMFFGSTMTVRALGIPAGGTYSWTSNCGTFDPSTSTVSYTRFEPTTVTENGWVQVQYDSVINGKAVYSKDMRTVIINSSETVKFEFPEGRAVSIGQEIPVNVNHRLTQIYKM